MPSDREIKAAVEAVIIEIAIQRRDEYEEWDAKAIAKASLEAAEQSRQYLYTDLVVDREFMQVWVSRINNGETTPDEFMSVVRHYPEFKATKNGIL